MVAMSCVTYARWGGQGGHLEVFSKGVQGADGGKPSVSCDSTLGLALGSGIALLFCLGWILRKQENQVLAAPVVSPGYRFLILLAYILFMSDLLIYCLGVIHRPRAICA